jgi:transposase
MPPSQTKRLQALRRSGTLNPWPEKVRHPLFAQSLFFDAHDLLQLKYEMLRALRTEGCSITQVAADSGLSRPTIYQAQASFAAAGFGGLLPHKRGPKHPHKLNSAVMEQLTRWCSAHPEWEAAELAAQLKQRLRLTIHPRTIEKALAARAKRGRRKT